MRDALGSIRSVLVLGGTSEIGLATAEALVRQRGAARVVLAGRDRPRMDAGTAPLERAGAQVELTEFDAEAVDAHEGVVEQIWQEHGDIDVTILAFGVLGDQAVAEKDPRTAVHIAMVNYVGAMSVGLHVANRMERQGHGTLVVLSSVAGERARRANYVYGSSKAGLDAFAQGLGDRLAKVAGHVLVVRPGFVHTRMTTGMDPAPFSTTPEAVATDIVRALDRRAHTVHSPNVLRWVMTVLRHLPRALFRLLPR